MASRDQIVNPKGVRNFNARRYTGIYPLQNRLDKGWGVDAFPFNPERRGANARMVNMRGDKIDFFVEEIEANFQMAGTTGQSQKVRQFFPHNMVQPSVTLTGRAQNSHQYNRLAAFVRAAQHDALSTENLRTRGIPLRNVPDSNGGPATIIPTIKMIIRNNSGIKGFPYNGRSVKGTHQGWVVEGYVKSMPAGARRWDPAPAFQFEFLIAESQGPRQGDPNIGIWADHAVAGDEIKPWIDIFKHKGKDTFTHNDYAYTNKIKGDDAFTSWFPF